MAIQVWTPFTADRSILAGGMEAAGAIGGGIHKLGDGITQALERQKQKSSLTTTLRKKLSILQPERKDEFNTMGLEDLTGEDLGHAERILRQRQEQEMEARAMRQALEQREMQRREAMEQREMQQREALPRLYKELSETGQAPESVPAPVSNEEFDRRTAPRDVMTALARSGAAVQPDDAARLQMAMDGGRGGRAGGTPFFNPQDVNRALDIEGLPNKKRIIMGPNESSVVDVNMEPEAVADPESGTLLGHNVPNGRGGFRFMPAPIASGLTPRDRLQALTRQYDTLMTMPTPENKAQAARIQQEIEKIMGKEPGAAAAPAAGAAPGVVRKWNPQTRKLEPAR